MWSQQSPLYAQTLGSKTWCPSLPNHKKKNNLKLFVHNKFPGVNNVHPLYMKKYFDVLIWKLILKNKKNIILINFLMKITLKNNYNYNIKLVV